MFGYISRQASSVTVQPRPDASLDAIGKSTRSTAGRRQALGQALVSLGQRVAGEMPPAMAQQPESDCV